MAQFDAVEEAEGAREILMKLTSGGCPFQRSECRKLKEDPGFDKQRFTLFSQAVQGISSRNTPETQTLSGSDDANEEEPAKGDIDEDAVASLGETTREGFQLSQPQPAVENC